MSKLSEALNEAREAADDFDVALEGDSGDAEIEAALRMRDAIRTMVEAWSC